MVRRNKRQYAQFLTIYAGSVLFFIWSNFFVSPLVFASTIPEPSKGSVTTPSHIVTLAISNTAFHTPGQGWILYGTPKDQTAATLSYGVVDY